MAKLIEITHEESYETIYSFGLKKWWKGGVKYLMEENEDPKEVMKSAQAFIEESFKASYQREAVVPEPVVQSGNPKLDQTQSIIRDISTCSELKTIEAYRLIAKNNPEIQKVYDIKLKQLQK